MRPDPLVVRLRAAGCVFAEEEAALLRAAADGAALEVLVGRRVAGEPLEVLVGSADVAGVRVRLGAGVFVPRQRSAALVDAAVDLGPRAGDVVVDLCCGTGALGLALARRVPGIELHAADLDTEACRWARVNLDGVGTVHQGDLFDALPRDLVGRVSLVLLNAPYVPTAAIAAMPPEARDHEPRLALDGGPDGTDVQRRAAHQAGEWIAAGGTVLVETSTDQRERTADAFDVGLWRTGTWADEAARTTVVRATRR